MSFSITRGEESGGKAALVYQRVEQPSHKATARRGATACQGTTRSTFLCKADSPQRDMS